MIVHSTREMPALPISNVTLVAERKPALTSSNDTPEIVINMTGGEDERLVITELKGDCMSLQNNITLHLCGEFNPVKQAVNFRIRYLRIGDGGTTLEDVMLRKHNPIK